MRLRSSEWLLIGYFSYVALVSAGFGLPFVIALLVTALIVILASSKFFGIARDWAPLGLTLVAYREMDWFTRPAGDHHLELRWIQWDRDILYGWGLQRAIEWWGALAPGYLEFCYLLVYAVGPFLVAMFSVERRRERVNQALLLYLLGTLLSYALFPYFPSQPPRTLFGGSDLPNVMTALRRFNLWIVNGYGIHSSVFPSAHVSSAFSAGWALLLYLPERRRYGWGMVIYAASVAVAAVYGRYHYGVDVVAGLGVSLVAAAIVMATNKRE